MTRRIGFLISSVVAALALAGCAAASRDNRVVRVGVIGGMMKTGLWPAITTRFEIDTGYKVEVALSGNRELLAEGFRAGHADLITLHSGDTSADLVAEG